jgi:hypothetical protein
MTRLSHAWRAMTSEQRLAGLASVALLVTMLFPWYGLQSLNRRTGAINSQNISAFGDVSFVEAAVFLVAVGVLVIVLARAEGRNFQLPGGDGLIVTIAGGWAGLLIFYRVFSRPAGHGYPVGIEWGFFLAFVAAGALTYAGWRMRAAERPEPPLARARVTHLGERRPAPEVISAGDPASPPERGAYAGEPSTPAQARPASETGPPADDEVTVVGPLPPRPPRPRPAPVRGRAGRAPYPPAPPEQLSFEDPPPGSK